ncbi:MAG: GNAT family N-acetyltransferase [Candidatus Eremiobacteraeota bacterium]|nr:GNAT family N-acetyltransferase [Candidatus Eremiobacteraeota bacterium]
MLDVEIAEVRPERTGGFRREHAREAASTLWGFTVIPQEQRHEFAAIEGDEVRGVLAVRISASLAHVESLVVATEYRRRGIGRRLLARAEEIANYYNCHKVTLEVPAVGPARGFFEACGYKTEAVLPQHTFKKDVAVLRKFLL